VTTAADQHHADPRTADAVAARLMQLNREFYRAEIQRRVIEYEQRREQAGGREAVRDHGLE
jgi:hypothetical protein